MNLDTSKIFQLVSNIKKVLIDSVVIMFYVNRKGGLSNLRIKYSGNQQLESETIRLMKLSCPYWIPPIISGINISGWTQLVFTFNIKYEAEYKKVFIKAINPLQSRPNEIIF